jgi:hypothetical protein
MNNKKEPGTRNKNAKWCKNYRALFSGFFLAPWKAIENTYNIIDPDIFLSIAAVCMWFH